MVPIICSTGVTTIMAKRIIPATGRLLLKPIELKSDGGIVLSGQTKNEYSHATIIAIGMGKLIIGGERLKSEFKVGDTVIYGNRGDTVEDELNSERVFLVVTEAIIAKVED